MALTFDDGPDPQWTPRTTGYTRRSACACHVLHAGRNARAQPELVRRVVAEGHEVGLHGLDHRNLVGGSRQSTRRRTEAAASELATIAETPVTCFRPPFMAQTVASFLGARDAGLETVVCDLDSFDWSGLEEQQVASRVVVQAVPGSIVLLHDHRADDPRWAFDRSKTLQLIVDGLESGVHCTALRFPA